MTLEHASILTLFLAALLAFAAPRAFGEEPGWKPGDDPRGDRPGTPAEEELKRTLDDAWGDEPWELKPELRKRLIVRIGSKDWDTRRRAVCALRRAGADESLEATMDQLLKETERLVMEEITKAVGRFGNAALPRVLTRLEAAPAGNGHTRLLACALLAGEKMETRIEELSQALAKSPDAVFQEFGLLALARTMTWAGAKALIDMVQRDGSYTTLYEMSALQDPRFDDALLTLLPLADPRAGSVAINLLDQRGAKIPEKALLEKARGADPEAKTPDEACLSAFHAIARHPFADGVAVLVKAAFSGRERFAWPASEELLACWDASAPAVLEEMSKRRSGWPADIKLAIGGEELSFGDSHHNDLAPYVEDPEGRDLVLKKGFFALTRKKNSHVWETVILPVEMARTAGLPDGRTSVADLVVKAGWDADGRKAFGRFCLTLNSAGLLAWDDASAAWDPAELTKRIPDAPDGFRLTAPPALFGGFWGE